MVLRFKVLTLFSSTYKKYGTLSVYVWVKSGQTEVSILDLKNVNLKYLKTKNKKQTKIKQIEGYFSFNEVPTTRFNVAKLVLLEERNFFVYHEQANVSNINLVFNIFFF